MNGFDVRIDEYGEEYLIPTKEGVKQQRQLRLKLLLLEAGINKPDHSLDQYQGKDAARNLPKIRKYIDEFERFKTVNLYLWSNGNASQKTTVAKNIIVELFMRGYSCRFTLMADLLSLLQNAQFDEALNERAAQLRDVDFLVIDDAFDPRKATVYKSGYQFSFLDTFLRYRIETVQKATCFTSNISIDNITDNWTPSIKSLVKRSVPTPMEFTDYIDDFNKENTGLWD